MEPQEHPKNHNHKHPASSKEAAANVVRNHIETIYDHADKSQTNPYLKTHSTANQINQSDWEKYHTAWQNYYQKYYEGYYRYYANKLTNQPEKVEEASDKEKKTEKVSKLRGEIHHHIKTSAEKAKKSRHYKPLVSAIIVVLVFALLQYNRIIIANVYAYISPGAINPQNVVVDPLTDTKVSSEPKLIIPKINVDVPVLYDVGNDYDSQMAAMAKGVAHFAIPGASSHPGEIGNTVLSGHSSNGIFDTGDYKFIFAQLEKLSVGDVIYAHYNGTRYTYSVTKTETVEPTDVAKLVYSTNKPMMTLITCTPLGTARYRLLVTAEQISPSGDKATMPAVTTAKTETTMPGSSPTFFEWLFNLL